jgi:hypothetical protein
MNRLTNDEVVSWLGLDRATVRAGVDQGMTWREVAELCTLAGEHARQLADHEAQLNAPVYLYVCQLPCPHGPDVCAAHGCQLQQLTRAGWTAPERLRGWASDGHVRALPRVDVPDTDTPAGTIVSVSRTESGSLRIVTNPNPSLSLSECRQLADSLRNLADRLSS